MHLVTSLRRPLAWAQPLPPLALVTLALLVTGLVAAGWQGSVALRDLSLSPAALAADGSGSVPYTEPQQGAGELTIPRILHQIYIGPPGDASEGPRGHGPLIASCRYAHPPAAGWRRMQWNASSAEALMAERFPRLLPFYRSLSKLNEKADLVRYAVLHVHGGLYLDSDVECWRESSDMLAGADVVAQSSWEEEGCASAMLASRPGEPVWDAALRMAAGRRQRTGVDSTLDSIERTGPILLADAFESLGVDLAPILLAGALVSLDVRRNASRELAGKGLNRRLFGERYQVGSTQYRFWPAGTWYTPCLFWQDRCMADVLEARADGVTDMRRVVGMHRYRGSWIDNRSAALADLRSSAKHLICAPFLATAQRRRQALQLGDRSAAASAGAE